MSGLNSNEPVYGQGPSGGLEGLALGKPLNAGSYNPATTTTSSAGAAEDQYATAGGLGSGQTGDGYGATGGLGQGQTGDGYGSTGGLGQGRTGDGYGATGGLGQGQTGDGYGSTGGSGQGRTGDGYGATGGLGQGQSGDGYASTGFAGQTGNNYASTSTGTAAGGTGDLMNRDAVVAAGMGAGHADQGLNSVSPQASGEYVTDSVTGQPHFKESAIGAGFVGGTATGAVGTGAYETRGGRQAVGETGATSNYQDNYGAGGASGGATGPGSELRRELDMHKSGEGIHDPKHAESKGPHGLVFDEATGKYLHRRELTHEGSTGVPLK